eukprot:CAMPEP_0184650984 /NCGR_PEP_ID=MMETSP0308-20130426/8545_1 /TAXON_ID=38269 /ORGANISM="Gloeochaete witrockiana, Strain SAG 46.84" /LENGTH=296 /DNA_ID=CAMNT_0027084873 /DNA_START=418 /DNA_END=1308 /DNA_ORIENTATION=+
MTHDEYLLQNHNDNKPDDVTLPDVTLICPEKPCVSYNDPFARTYHVHTIKREGVPYMYGITHPAVRSYRAIAFSARLDHPAMNEMLDYAKRKGFPDICKGNGLWSTPKAKYVRAVDTFIGHTIRGPYLAVHWRMEDFRRVEAYKHLISVEVFAEKMKFHLRSINISTVFLATNANSTEQEMLLSQLHMYRILRSCDLLPIFYNDQHHGPQMVEEEDLNDHVVLEKEVCARADVFKSSMGSTFSGHIDAIREARRVQSPLDGLWHVTTGSQTSNVRKRAAEKMPVSLDHEEMEHSFH